MTRSLMVIFVTIVVLAGGFALYLWQQPAAPAQSGTARARSTAGASGAAATAPATLPANASIPVTAGENVFVETYDQKTGELAMRFRAARYDPQADGTVRVDKPEAEFYIRGSGGRTQLLRLRGNDGEIVVPSTGGAAGSGTAASAIGARAQPPSRGVLRDVRIMLFEPGAKQPTLTCRMNNVSFDNDTFRIATEAYTDESGNRVAADQVPVQVRGDDYDFDGRGLTVHWDERNRRLQLLEIAHGKALVIKNPRAFMPKLRAASGSDPTTRQSVGTAQDEDGGRGSPNLAGALAMRGDSDAAGVFAPATAPAVGPVTRRRVVAGATQPLAGLEVVEVDPYRAAFRENVRVLQNDQPLATADVLNVDFVTVDQERPVDGATGPARRPGRTATRPANADEGADGAASRRRGRAASGPTATALQDAPVVIQWTGPLRVGPLPEDVPVPEPGDTVVQLVGEKRPVFVRWDGGEMRCGSCQVHSIDSTAEVMISEQVPEIVLRDAQGAVVRTRSMRYFGEERTAFLEGASDARLPVDSPGDAGSPKEFANLTWTESCALRLSGDGAQSLQLDQARIKGDVRIEHPQMRLRCDRLETTFAPPDAAGAGAPGSGEPGRALRAMLRQAVASGDVKGTLSGVPSMGLGLPGATTSPAATPRDEGARPAPTLEQSIECDKLVLDLARDSAGRPYVSTVNAEGGVIARAADGELRAGSVAVALDPAAREPTTLPVEGRGLPSAGPEIELRTLVARRDVVARTTPSDGRAGSLRADQLTIDRTSRDRIEYRVQGDASRPAMIESDSGNLSGSIIVFRPVLEQLEVIGPGSLRGMQPSARAPASAEAREAPREAPRAVSTTSSDQPVDVTWTSGLELDGRANRMQLRGAVTARTTSEDGAENLGRADTVQIEMADDRTVEAPASPATHPAGAPGGSPVRPGSDLTSPLGNRRVQSVTLVSDGAASESEVCSTLLQPDGSLARRMHLFSRRISYDVAGERLTVPGPGRLLYQDERPTTTVRPGTAASGLAAGDLRGATAFQWGRQFVFDSASRYIEMSGAVTVVHRALASRSPGATSGPADRPGDLYRLNAGRVDVELAAESTTPGAGSGAQARPDMRGLRPARVTASDGVTFLSQRLQFASEQVGYDVEKGVIAARGTDRTPAQLLDEGGLSQGTFRELYYDVNGDRITRMVDFRAAVRGR